MIEVPMSEHYSKNQERQNDMSPGCAVCGKLVKSPKHHIRYFWGSHAVTNTEANEIIAREGYGGDMGLYAIGTDCLKKHPELKPYVEDAAAHMYDDVDESEEVVTPTDIEILSVMRGNFHIHTVELADIFGIGYPEMGTRLVSLQDRGLVRLNFGWRLLDAGMDLAATVDKSPDATAIDTQKYYDILNDMDIRANGSIDDELTVNWFMKQTDKLRELLAALEAKQE